MCGVGQHRIGPGGRMNTTLSNGDTVLLFQNLPFEFDMDLPLTPSTGVSVDSTPHSVLQTPDDDHLPCYVLPGTKLPGMGINNCCLVSKASSPGPREDTPESRLFLYVAALRLLAPAPISIAGQFVYGGDDDPISRPKLLNMQSMWQPDTTYRYCGAELLCGGRILDRINSSIQTGPERLKCALMMFTQITTGFSTSYQMCVLGLYTALEALFEPSGRSNYAKTLGSRVGQFLSSFDEGIGIGDWIQRHYISERHSLSHGFWQFSPDPNHFSTRQTEFGKLHEILRLSLLGFLSMEPTAVAFLALPKKKRQQPLDDLKPATGDFLRGQKMWLS